MVTLEEKGRVRKKRRDLQRVLLSTVAMVGVVSVAMVAPNVIGALSKLGMLPHKNDRTNITRARRRLKEKGLLQYDGRVLRITQKGKELLAKIEARERLYKKPPRWDGRWRVLIFDIPEHRRSLRDKIRRTLLEIGFKRLQDSVWIYPYDCEDFVTLLKADFKIGKDVLYMIVDELEYDVPVKKLFGL